MRLNLTLLLIWLLTATLFALNHKENDMKTKVIVYTFTLLVVIFFNFANVENSESNVRACLLIHASGQIAEPWNYVVGNDLSIGPSTNK